MIIRWHGTAAVEIESEGRRLLFDPFVPLPGSPVKTDISDFDGYDTVLITHGHFDHIASIPEISIRNPGMQIYCTKTPYAALIRKGVPETVLHEISYGQVLSFGGITVKTYHGKHAVLPKSDPKAVFPVFFRKNLKNLGCIIRENRSCRENDETVFYLVETGGKRIAVMGSLNLRDDENYPVGCDMLVLPYNGWADNYPPAVEIIEKLKPGAVLLDHYDNTFPPVTGDIDLNPVRIRFPGLASRLEMERDFEI